MANDIPCAVVNTLADVIVDDHLASTGLLDSFVDESLGKLLYLRPGFSSQQSETAASLLPSRPPRLGEHGPEILAQLGMTTEEIQALIAEGVLGGVLN